MRLQTALLWLLAAIPSLAQSPTYFPSGPDTSQRVSILRKEVMAGETGAEERFWKAVRKSGAPLIEPIRGNEHFSLVTFLWHGNADTHSVVIFDGVAGFDAKDRMVRLANTNVWYKTYKVRNDAQFAYNFSRNDPLTSVNDIKGDDAMRDRLAMLQVDPLNPHRCPATFGAHTAESSFVELRDAPPLIWNEPASTAAKGKVEITKIQSGILKEEKKLWVYTPPRFSANGDRYPLMVLFDGDRNVMWMPKILDDLIAMEKVPPMVAVLVDNSIPRGRRAELPCNIPFGDFLAKELVPWSRERYHTTMDASETVVAGSSFGGLASVFAGLRHSNVFGNVVSLSGSFWWKPDGEKEPEWLIRQVQISPKLPLRFYLEVGLMENYPMQIVANQHMRDVLNEKGYPVQYFEYDGGHAFLNWSGGMTRGLVFLLGRNKAARITNDSGKVYVNARSR